MQTGSQTVGQSDSKTVRQTDRQTDRPNSLHTYIHTYIHKGTYKHTYIHTCIPRFAPTYVPTYVPMYTIACMHAPCCVASKKTCIHPSTRTDVPYKMYPNPKPDNFEAHHGQTGSLVTTPAPGEDEEQASPLQFSAFRGLEFWVLSR